MAMQDTNSKQLNMQDIENHRQAKEEFIRVGPQEEMKPSAIRNEISRLEEKNKNYKATPWYKTPGPKTSAAKGEHDKQVQHANDVGRLKLLKQKIK